MLVLTRRIGEEIIIRFNGQEVRVSLQDMWANQARLGFEAPDEVEIIREEINSTLQDALDATVVEELDEPVSLVI